MTATHGLPYAVPGTFPTKEDADRLVDTTLEYGWYAASERRAIEMAGDEPWPFSDADAQTRAALHAWEPIDPFLFAHSFDPGAPLDHVFRFARAWTDLGLAPTEPDLGAAGRRALRLGYVAQATRDAHWIARARELGEALESQIDANDISPASTDAVVGLATLQHRLDGSVADKTAKHVLTHFAAAFTSDGVHRTQSPGVHAHVLDRLVMVLAAKSVRHRSLIALRLRAERFLAWVLDPTGAPANIGVTTTTRLTSAFARQPSGLRLVPDRVEDRALRHALTAGRFGAQPGNPMEVFPEGGFAVIKVPWPRRLRRVKPASHLVMRTGTTDHAADSAGPVLTWHDRGLRVLVEPGRMLEEDRHPAGGYPQRAESHNTVVVEDATHRTGDDGTVHYGSHRNRFHVRARFHIDNGTHERTVVLDPGRWLLVLDRVEGVNDAEVAVRFHTGDELDLVTAGDGFTLLSGQKPVAWAVSLSGSIPATPERGRLEPQPSGWWSPDGTRMVPNWAFGWDGRGATTFATVISLEGRPTPDRVDAPWIGWHTAKQRVRVAVTEWGVSDVVVEPATEEER